MTKDQQYWRNALEGGMSLISKLVMEGDIERARSYAMTVAHCRDELPTHAEVSALVEAERAAVRQPQ